MLDGVTLRAGALVLYKNRPALVRAVRDKIELEVQGGKRVRVRPKDVALLHPGPLEDLAALEALPPGEVEAAWELLAGEETTLAELAELAYGAYTPQTAWAAWRVGCDGVYFEGTPEALRARTPAAVRELQAQREAAAREAAAWEAFIARLKEGRVDAEDRARLAEVEVLALGRTRTSRVLRALGRHETPENAHALLLEVGYWTPEVNPYPARLGVDPDPPRLEVPDLPQEPRRDLTHLEAYAIDDETTEDPDDDLSLEVLDAGYRLWVHVADVGALVRPDSSLDRAARERGASVYLPEGTIPMLPPEVARRLGLGMGEVSPALSFALELSAAGELLGVEVVPSWVRVQRLTYAEVEARLMEAPFAELVRLAEALRARRAAAGAVFIELPEVKVRVVDGEVRLWPVRPLRSRALVREAMLAAGVAAARFALEHGIPFPFATQEPPGERPELGGLAGMFAQRRALKRTQLKSVPAPHAGLGLEVYAQATSPLRRYLDLVAHQQLRAFLRGEALIPPQALLERVGAAEAVAGSVRQAERLSRRHWTLVHLVRLGAWEGEGVLVERRGYRGVVLLPELGLEASVVVPEALALNQSVRLRLSEVDLARLEARFTLC